MQDFAGKNVCILGFGREGRATAEALQEYAKGVEITVADTNETIDVPKEFRSQLGTDWLRDLETFDIIIKSPGIPPRPEFSRIAEKLTSPTQISLDSVKASGATVIGVTGSKGKSTTSTLIYSILIAAKKDAYLVGNIGKPAIAHLHHAGPNAFFVYELSSYQLMDLTVSPDIAVVTSFFPEHLDYHASTLLSTSGSPLENYLDAKKHITRYQTKKNLVFFNADFPEAREIANESKGKKIPFSAKHAPVQSDEILLQGEHNLGNIAGAWSVVQHLGIDEEVARNTIRSFKGLPHRLESIAVVDGIEWVNDSISTTPETAVAALEALGSRVSVIILGGQDRGYDFTPLAKAIKESPSLRMAILLPDSGTVIGKAIEHAGASIILSEALTIQEAVGTARKAARDPEPEGIIPIVLLSPAAPSYGHFKNFEDRGEQFRKEVSQGSGTE